MNQKEALLAGAKKCLVEKGYGRTTARDIAEASGAHLGSIGYHYGSKDRLMNRAAMELSSEWGDLLTALTTEAQGETPRARLGALLAAISDSLPQTRAVQSASLQAFAQAQFDESLHAEVAAGSANGREEVTALMTGRSGSAPEASAGKTEAEAALGSLAFALIAGLITQFLIDPDSVPSPAQMRAALDLLAEDAPGSPTE
ncbi:TetR/AcrR family transcriptional regulator [Brevibacterium album]|uniref:TetR/AcrR family transcriptional regulator n=1 Tax=Brevibacterium album TaxID=417948 RepID=UPI0004149D5B|nr:TetR/AcrR family transcriptional regulator [Brevibacterium album]